MNLVALATRMCAVQALRGSTLAQQRVYDSAISPLDLTKDQEAQPLITVAVDDGEITPDGRNLLTGSQQLSLIIEVACASRVSITLPPEEVPEGEEPEQEIVTVPHTDAGLEVILDLMGRQVDRALLAGGPWSDLFRWFVVAIPKVTHRRGAGSEKGVRFAAHQIILTCQTLAEPAFAHVPPDGPWARLLELMRADPAMRGIANLLEAEIATPNLNVWQQAITDLGMRESNIHGIGLGPAGDLPINEAPAPLRETNIVHAGAEWPINQNTAADALGPEEGNA